jgi:hypothetical protein
MDSLEGRRLLAADLFGGFDAQGFWDNVIEPIVDGYYDTFVGFGGGGFGSRADWEAQVDQLEPVYVAVLEEYQQIICEVFPFVFGDTGFAGGFSGDAAFSADTDPAPPSYHCSAFGGGGGEFADVGSIPSVGGAAAFGGAFDDAFSDTAIGDFSNMAPEVGDLGRGGYG